MSFPFNIGDSVTWTSQAAGFSVEKAGQIAEIVRAGAQPSRERFPALYKSGIGSPRRDVSYVVMVGRKAYWPLANKLGPCRSPGSA